MSGIAGVAADARELAGRADALGLQCEALAASTQDEATRATLARAAGRLDASVVRPLTAALGGAPDRVEPPPPAGEADLAQALHQLAVDATRLRVRAAGAPSLQEATAALQDLACQAVAGDVERLEARRTELGALLAGLPPTIQSAPDGPYLVTNVTTVTDWLGVSLDPPPQAALCRCGASQLKPWCDGSHAQIGFHAAKADDRVPDRLDRYHGLHVTIGDNRGTCAHSGLCSDRLPTAFRTAGEPFVAPAGGRVDEILRAARDCPSGALSATIAGDDPVGASDSAREAAIEVSHDGPYRVTGSIELLDGDGRPEPRNAGASLEHCSLCRCGKSQNKPFCSGMHWYADFHDPSAVDEATLFQWAGGFPALLRLTRRFYETHVPQDPLLSDLFSQMSPDHPERVAAWLGQVFGGPPAYSERYGEYDRMISQHLDKALTREQRARWVVLLALSADEVGLPSDAEFRAAFIAYLEWGSRLALENSQPGVHPPPHMPVPRWWWVCDAYPWSRAKATAEAVVEEPTPELPGPDEPLSYAVHVKPLFRARDRDSMRFAFDLWSHDDVSVHGEAILERLRAGTMPCDGAWPPERVDVLERWIAAGAPA
ncbi:MAG TPA: CDGSH iron-sulfur domain-containing protein [Conexibacter sp.]|jgi:CDGSH-type Zn-finger protein/truncated hemoglobin YjbI|nr:CDGSH iron-sulfur domain-containing protein [Conexibacter sp.]